MHISNRHFDLKPVVDAIAEHDHLSAVAIQADDTYFGGYSSTWVLVAPDPDRLKATSSQSGRRREMTAIASSGPTTMPPSRRFCGTSLRNALVQSPRLDVEGARRNLRRKKKTRRPSNERLVEKRRKLMTDCRDCATHLSDGRQSLFRELQTDVVRVRVLQAETETVVAHCHGPVHLLAVLITCQNQIVALLAYVPVKLVVWPPSVNVHVKCLSGCRVVLIVTPGAGEAFQVPVIDRSRPVGGAGGSAGPAAELGDPLRRRQFFRSAILCGRRSCLEARLPVPGKALGCLRPARC